MIAGKSVLRFFYVFDPHCPGDNILNKFNYRLSSHIGSLQKSLFGMINLGVSISPVPRMLSLLIWFVPHSLRIMLRSPCFMYSIEKCGRSAWQLLSYRKIRREHFNGMDIRCQTSALFPFVWICMWLTLTCHSMFRVTRFKALQWPRI